jgi:acyl-CoA thioesterase-1
MVRSSANNVRRQMPAVSTFPSRRAFLRQSAAFCLAASAFRAAGAEDPAPPPAAPAGKTLLFFGDSLTAGYGLDDPATESYSALVGGKLKAAYPAWKIVNAGLSGETTSGGLRRIDWVLRQPVEVFFLALGGNDGLRGIPAAVTKSNLEAIIIKVRAKNPKVKIVLAGMKMPISMGTYATDFSAVYPAIAKADPALQLIPFLLEGVGGMPTLNQPDAIHPNPEGHRKVADHAWQTLEPLVKAAGN